VSLPETAAADHAPFLERLFTRLPEERSYRVEGVEGSLPPWLRGTYYLNGPGRFSRGDVAYRHWLDGDGMVCALTFGDDGVTFTNRFVRSTKWSEEEAAGRALYRTFGTAFPGDRLVRGIALASPVNVSVYPCCGRLLAFGEQGLPWELEPAGLETLGEHTFGGRLNAISPFSAHPHVDRGSGELFNFGVSFSAHRPVLHLYRFSAAGDLLYRRRHDLDAPRSVHDFGLSGRHAVFYLSPYLLDMEALAGGGTLLDCLVWEPERGSLLSVFAREDGGAVATVGIGSGYCLHLVNCFDDGERLVVDVVELEEPVYPDYLDLPDRLFAAVRPGRPVRRVVDPASGEVVEERRLAYHRACDFPSLELASAARPYDDFWMLGISATGRPGRKFFDELVHLRWSAPDAVDAWRAPRGHYLGGEPAAASDPGDPSRSVVICQELDAGAGEGAFLVFDARRVGEGPVARLPLAEPIPPLFHACFDPA
jgi:all-trans-8'-apo-beta-carotenal 15,15'-oxygenase